ncbi:MAG: 30S ribosomal protein S3, partial [Candidatus Eremiobacteraeota bacterium]|nr:30S ribosomal protein S3 [Candidatus Eremiobacteraeota bacterium]
NVEAFTTFGRIGVKVWIYRGEVLPDGTRSGPTRGDRSGRDRGPRAGARSGAPGRPPRPATRPLGASESAESVVVAADPVVVEPAAPDMEATQ